MDRAFVPLQKRCFNDFERGKTYELRCMERGWTKKNIRKGRHVTISCGYSKDRRIEGKIGRVVVGSLNDIFRAIYFKKIEPRAKTVRGAKRMNTTVLGEAEKYIAFQIVRTKKRTSTRRGP